MPGSPPPCRPPTPTPGSSRRPCRAACNGRAGACIVESKGKQGEKCDLQDACQLVDLVHDWAKSPDEAGRRAAWDKILQINMEEVFTIGTVNGILQPIVVSPKLHNVPKEGYWAWDPGGYIGLYKPDTFWLSQ